MRTLAISHQRDAGPGVFAEAIAAAGHSMDVWHRAETDEPPADPREYDGVLTFGGAMHADQESEHAWLADEKSLLRELLAAEAPLLAVCLGAQLLAEAAGGEAVRASQPEIGWFEVELPQDAIVLARTPVCVQAYRVGAAAWAIQFHAEVSAADAAHWIADYHADEDAVRIGVDPEALRAETEAKIEGFNQLGRDLCARWLAAIA
jgi:GMP synthase (glutamine-hydrolysing)